METISKKPRFFGATLPFFIGASAIFYTPTHVSTAPAAHYGQSAGVRDPELRPHLVGNFTSESLWPIQPFNSRNPRRINLKTRLSSGIGRGSSRVLANMCERKKKDVGYKRERDTVERPENTIDEFTLGRRVDSCPSLGKGALHEKPYIHVLACLEEESASNEHQAKDQQAQMREMG